MNYTHTYRNKKGRDVQCFIDPSCIYGVEKLAEIAEFNVIVTNENGVDIYLQHSQLTKIEQNGRNK